MSTLCRVALPGQGEARGWTPGSLGSFNRLYHPAGRAPGATHRLPPNVRSYTQGNEKPLGGNAVVSTRWTGRQSPSSVSGIAHWLLVLVKTRHSSSFKKQATAILCLSGHILPGKGRCHQCLLWRGLPQRPLLPAPLTVSPLGFEVLQEIPLCGAYV